MTEPGDGFNMSVEDMLEDLDEKGAQIVIYSPRFFFDTSSRASNWQVDLKHVNEASSLALEIHGNKPLLRAAVRDVYFKWHEVMKKGVHQELMPEKREVEEAPPLDDTQKEVVHGPILDDLDNEAAGRPARSFDDEIPF